MPSQPAPLVIFIIQHFTQTNECIAAIIKHIDSIASTGASITVIAENIDSSIKVNSRVVFTKIKSPLISFLKKSNHYDEEVEKILKKTKHNLTISYGDATACDINFLSNNYALELEYITPTETRDISHEVRRQKQSLLANSYKLILTTSHATKKDLLMRYPLDSTRIEFLYPGYDKDLYNLKNRLKERTTARHSLSIQDSEYLVGLNCNFDPNKCGADIAFQLFKNLNEKFNIRFVINNADAFSTQAMELAKSQNLEDKIYVYKESSLDFIFCLDAYFFPARYCDFDDRLLHAMACGLPTLVSSRISNSEIVLSKQLVKNPEDSEGWLSGFQEIINNKDWCISICRQNAERVMALDAQHYGRRFIEVIQKHGLMPHN